MQRDAEKDANAFLSQSLYWQEPLQHYMIEGYINYCFNQYYQNPTMEVRNYWLDVARRIIMVYEETHTHEK